MTEAEWLTCPDPQSMLDDLMRGLVTRPRKHALFACACCRRLWHDLTDERSRQAIEFCEGCYDGLTNAGAREEVRWSAAYASQECEGAASAALRRAGRESRDYAASQALVWASWASMAAVEKPALLITHYGECGAAARASDCVAQSVYWATKATSRYDSEDSEREARTAQEAETAAHADLLRDIFGSPFRPIVMDSAWASQTVTVLARAAYDERVLPSGELDATHLTVLADALETAGCTNAEVLAHCREPGPHVRGCWALDLVLGKE